MHVLVLLFCLETVTLHVQWNTDDRAKRTEMMRILVRHFSYVSGTIELSKFDVIWGSLGLTLFSNCSVNLKQLITEETYIRHVLVTHRPLTCRQYFENRCSQMHICPASIVYKRASLCISVSSSAFSWKKRVLCMLYYPIRRDNS